MKKELFRLRHAALVSALALAMGAPVSFADEAPVEVPVVQPAPVDAPDVVVDVDAGVEPAPVDDPVAVVEPRPIDGAGSIDEPVVIDEPVAVEDPLPGDGGAVIDEPVPDDAVTMAPVDDCGMICWNTAGLPPEAVQKEITEPEVMQFGVTEAPEPSLNVSAELSGAVGAAEQLGATDAALDDSTSIAPLAATTAAAAVVANASEGQVNVIRDGHLR